MKKLSFVSVISILLVIGMLFTTVSGATITDLYVTDTQNATVLIKGNTENTVQIENTSIFMVKPGVTFTDAAFNTLTNSDFVFTDVVNSANDGSFQTAFSMGAFPSGLYNLHTVNQSVQTANKSLDYYTKTEIDTFLSTVDASRTDLQTNIVKYAPSIGLSGENLNLSVFDSADYLTMFVDNLWPVKSAGAITYTQLFDIYENSKLEMNFLNEIKAVSIQQQIKNIMDKTEYAPILSSAYTGVALNTSGYNGLDQVYQTYILDYMLSVRSSFKTAKSFTEKFNELVTACTTGTVILGGSTTTTGGGGGGGGTIDRDVSALDPVVSEERLYFDDLATSLWAVASINALSEQGVVAGVSYRTFEPEGYITREAFAKMVVMALGKYNADATSDFIDANDGEWYDSYVASAKDAELVKGIGDGMFGVGLNITRQDLAVILYKAGIQQGMTFNATKSFADDGEIASYAKEAVSYLAGAGIISGMGDDTFAPTANATRAQAAKLIYALIGGAN